MCEVSLSEEKKNSGPLNQPPLSPVGSGDAAVAKF